MTRTLLVVSLTLLVLLSYAGMRKGWNRRTAEQAAIVAPAPLAAAPVAAGPWSGTYLGATRAGDWLDRITVHGLGAKSPVAVARTASGINVTRAGERSFSVPRADFIAIRADKGIAGRAYEDGGIVVITFRLGDTAIDAGFRFPNTEDHLAALAALAPEVTS